MAEHSPDKMTLRSYAADLKTIRQERILRRKEVLQALPKGAFETTVDVVDAWVTAASKKTGFPLYEVLNHYWHLNREFYGLST